MDLLNSVSRRSFLKGMAAVGAAGAIAGCGGSSSDGGSSTPLVVDPIPNLNEYNVAYATCPHNCGPGIRCVSKIWTKNGRIVRVTTDDSEHDLDGNYRDKDVWNDPRQLSCAKGHSYRYRVYHTGRIKYPMKQTKKRGDVTGFVRITWEQAYNEVMRKHRAIYAKYGSAAIHSGANNTSSGRGARASDAMAPITSIGGTRGSFSDHSFHQFNYGAGISGLPIPDPTNYGTYALGSVLPAVIDGKIKNWVSFGTNSMSTNNTMSYPYLRANQIGKEKNANFKHYVISPELTDTGVLCATDWVQIRNQTDPALIAGMIYEMLVNTFNTDGSIKSDAWLDVDYIDTCLYGFFDSPEYYISTATATLGQISLTPGSGRKINAVPSGRSYAAWIMGDDDRLTKAPYSASTSYTAKKYGSMPRAGLCSLSVKGVNAYEASASSTKYYTKKNYMVKKSPEWAEKITGTPAATIRELARLYADKNNHPILTEWTGGLQKSENGVITLFAMQTLFALTKTWGHTITYRPAGASSDTVRDLGGMFQTWGSTPPNLGTVPITSNLPDVPVGATPYSDGTHNKGSKNPTTPSMSCKEHYNGLYFAFKDVLDGKNFSGKANPYWDGSTRYLNDDAGAKSQVLFKRSNVDASSNNYITYTDTDGQKYNDWVGRETNSPVYVGKRMYIGCSGTQFNQIANPNWVKEIFELLPLAQDNPDDADTFCWVVAEPYMSPQARFADYVFPIVNTLEAVDNTSVGGISFKRLPLSTPPGEAKDGWDAAFIGWNEQSKLGNMTNTRIDGANAYNKEIVPDAGYACIGESASKTFISATDKYNKQLENICKTNYRGEITVNQLIGSQIVPKTANPAITVTSGASTIRIAIDTYLVSSVTTAPFIKFAATNSFTPSVANAMNTHTAITATNAPKAHGKMTCYADYAVYTWENAYNIHHGWLPLAERGQKNKDYENDPKIYPIPMYYSFEDAFNEMYGVFNTWKPNRQDGWVMIGQKPATNDISLITDKLTVTVGSTHDRYRSHSSQAENPYLRELNHRTKGGGWLSGNDWNEYCVVPEAHSAGKTADFNPMISAAIQKKDLKTASWHEFWMNKEDAAQFGIADGDLIRISNPVGAIRCTARVTSRIVRGHGQIHQGAWYDPNPVDGVDDGACANTLMSNRPSKLDNGNSIHCAYCVVEKETSF